MERIFLVPRSPTARCRVRTGDEFVKTFPRSNKLSIEKEGHSFHGHFEEEANDETTEKSEEVKSSTVELVARTNKDSSLEFLRDFTKLFVRHIYGLDPMPVQVVK